MKKILLGYNFRKDGFLRLSQEFELIYPTSEYFKRHEILEIIEDFDVLIPNFSLKVDKEIIDKAKKLQLIANFGVGYDNIDADYAATKGIVVTNTPYSVLEPTAELCFGLILSTARRISFYDTQLRTSEGLSWGLYDHPGVAVFGKTLGICGMGRIGQAVARRAIASGMKIIYHNRKLLDSETEKKYNARYVSFDELLCTSDFISLNAPATNDTFHLFGKKEFEKMKPSAILINTARGSLVDELALINALQNKDIRGAGLDVYEQEPKINPAFFNLNNVVLTPHAGTQTIEGRLDMQREVESNILSYFNGGCFSKVN